MRNSVPRMVTVIWFFCLHRELGESQITELLANFLLYLKLGIL